MSGFDKKVRRIACAKALLLAPLEPGFSDHHILAAVAKRGRNSIWSVPKMGRLEFNCNRRSMEDIMRHVDFTPLYRSTVGFDRLFNMLDTMAQPDGNQTTYPPYNIERTDDNTYRITMAVAGFAEDDIAIEMRPNALSVAAAKPEEKEEDGREVLHRGIASRAFERRFQLADHVEVKGAQLENGLLHIDLVREIPEAMKPRKIAISAPVSKGSKQIEAKKN